MNILARDVSSILVSSEGDPSNWNVLEFNETNVRAIGLVSEPWLLDKDKIVALYNADYNISKKILGILGPNYNYEIMISKWNNTAYSLEYQIGEPVGNAEFVIVNSRYALLDGNWAKVNLKIWKQNE
jgi:hypothetical protein